MSGEASQQQVALECLRLALGDGQSGAVERARAYYAFAMGEEALPLERIARVLEAYIRLQYGADWERRGD